MILFHGGYVQNTCLGRQFQYGNSLLAVDDWSGIQRPLDGNWDIALLDHALHSGILARVHRIIAEGERRYRRWN